MAKSNKLKGTTKSGFKFVIDKDMLNDMRLFDAMAETEMENPFALTKVINLLLGKEQKEALYKHVETEKGNVPMDVLQKEITEIFNSQKETKNS